MKQTKVFTINKTDVFEEVMKHTAYEGAKTDETLYDRVRVKSGDKTMLERWWNDACGLVTTCLIPYVTTIGTSSATETTTAGNFLVTCGLPSNWNVQVYGDLGHALTDLVTDYLLQQWYLLLNAETPAKIAGEKQQTAIAKIGQLLYTRVRPTRPTFDEDIYG